MSDYAILIVEDDRWLGGILVRSLGRMGHRVRLATTLAEARAALAEAPPDVVLLDVDLPDGAGWELLGDRQTPVARTIIVMSAGQPARRRLEQFRPTCFLSKPFALDTLLSLIEQTGAEDDETHAPARGEAGAGADDPP